MEDVVDAAFPNIHLRTILNLDSLGHFLRDNVMPLVDVPLRFGLDPQDFVWIMCPSGDVGQWETMTHDIPMLEHYKSWLPGRKGQLQHAFWTDLMAPYIGGVLWISLPSDSSTA